MKAFRVIFAIILLLTFSQYHSAAQDVKKINIADLEKILSSRTDKLYVLNLWATWCAPCVKELPAFEKVAAEYDRSKVEFIMVSLDFPSQIETQLIPFLKKRQITLDVSVMMETDHNLWIEKVDPSWQGNIPSTLFFNNSDRKRHFHPGEIDENEIRKMIKKLI